MEKICENCGHKFTPKNPKGRFCTTRCRVAFNRKNTPVPLKEEEITFAKNALKNMTEKVLSAEPIVVTSTTPEAFDSNKFRDVFLDEAPKFQETKKATTRKPYMNDAIKKRLYGG